VHVQFNYEDGLAGEVFTRTADDEKEGYSVDDRAFLQIMDREF
jgi:hypothetical protein